MADSSTQPSHPRRSEPISKPAGLHLKKRLRLSHVWGPAQLRVARLDAIAPDTSKTVDLKATAASVVATLAPWVIQRGRSLALIGTDKPVYVQGNADAIEDAIRNLVENAVAHSPVGEEVTVEVLADGL